MRYATPMIYWPGTRITRMVLDFHPIAKAGASRDNEQNAFVATTVLGRMDIRDCL